MAQFRNNHFGHDNDAEHIIRVEFCVSGLAEYEGEIELPGTLAEDLLAHHAVWNPLKIDVNDQMGDQMAATGLIKKLRGELRKLIVSARYMVQSVGGGAETEAGREVIFEDYGAVGTIPNARLKLIALAKKMVETNARYVADGSPFALPEEPFDAMSAKIDALEEAIKKQDIEKSERHHAAVAKSLERKKGDKLLSNIFNWLCALWGYEDTRLLTFGFVPKSQIWTRKRKKVEDSL